MILTIKHSEIIRQLYPSVVTLRDGVAYDANENIVEYDKELVDAEVLKDSQ